MRNTVLNKHLSRHELMTASKAALDRRFTRFKLGWIETGFETPEDFKEGFDEVFEMLDYRDTILSGSRFQGMVTGLVCEVATPLYYWPRVQMYKHWLEHQNELAWDWPYEPLTNRGIQIRRLSDRKHFYLQELLQAWGRDCIKLLMNPIFEGRVKSWQAPEYAIEVSRQMKELGIDAKATFLNPPKFGDEKDPFQHLEINPRVKLFKKMKAGS